LFFFQAEDGIRDGHVTGVQTCALPILMDISRLPTRVMPSFLVSLATAKYPSRVMNDCTLMKSTPLALRSSTALRPSSPVAIATEIGRASCRGRVIKWVVE